MHDFYANADLTDGFGATGAHRRNPHRGLDFPHAWGTAIPAILGGTVVISEYSHVLGWIVEIAADDGTFHGYRHRTSADLTVGQRIETGDTVGYVGDTGSASTGAHLCLTIGTAQGAVYGVPGLVIDPWPYLTTIEGDEMYTDQDRTRDDKVAKQVGEIHWMLEQRVRPQLDRLEGVGKDTGRDGKSRLRIMDEIHWMLEQRVRPLLDKLAAGKIEDDHATHQPTQ